MSMIEKAARAVFAQSFHPDDRINGRADAMWEEWPEDRRRAFRQARAAVEALMKATPEMVTAAAIATDGWRFGQGTSINASIENALRAALSAALNEGEGA